MARTFAAAFAAVFGTRFDEVVGYTVRRREPVPTDPIIAEALAGVDVGVLLKVGEGLAGRRCCQKMDADEALGDALLKLWLEQRELRVVYARAGSLAIRALEKGRFPTPRFAVGGHHLRLDRGAT